MNNFLLILTESAKKYLKSYLKEGEALHIHLKPSGCSGYAYVLTANKVENENVFIFQDISFIVNEKNQPSLNNSIIDYKREGLNSKLVIDNPSAKNHCGCGESFSLKEVV